MPTDEAMAIQWYVHGMSKREGWVQASSFRALLRDARGAAQRNLETGDVMPGTRSASWLSALGYLVLLDQLGGVLRPRDAVEPSGEREFITALRLFAPDVLDDHRSALYALRCPLVHDYTLYNPSENPQLNHYFNLDPEQGAPLVVVPPPERRWNGTAGEGSAGDATRVGLRTLGDLVERIVRQLETTPAEELRIAPAVGSPKDLLVRYSFQYWED